jgi:predicted nucleic acid-binding protein
LPLLQLASQAAATKMLMADHCHPISAPRNSLYRDPSQGHIRRPRLDAILASLPVLAFDEDSALAYRQILAASGYSRRKLLDRMIAAQALVHQAT